MSIKESNYWALHDDFVLMGNTRIVGSKLIALNRLIERKGTLLNMNNEQVKGIEIKKDCFVAIKIKHFKENSFFPCKIQKMYLQKI